MSDSEDDSIFDDDLNDAAINDIINRAESLKKRRQQRNLYGEVVPDQYQYEEIQPIDTPKSYPPTHHFIDYDNLSTYIYPTNFEVRDYQYNMVQRAFYDNLLVALPTGLGKTFIASTVMLNFLRWFPSSKIIFMAPTKPLVAQQIKACCGITGIPSSKVAILLDKTRRNRKDIWDSKSVFFTTPQLVENDLATGLVDPKSVVLLVVDEAHRAKGNYAYNNVVKFLKRFSSSFRILALTATPASDVEGVQEIIHNLEISKVEVRTERSIDIAKYMKNKKIERRTVDQSTDIIECIDLLCVAIKPVLDLANERKIYDMADPSKINAFKCMEASQRIIKNPSIPEGLKWSNYFILQLLGVVGQCYRRLNIYGIRSFYNFFKEKHLEFTTKWQNKKSNNKMNADFYFSDPINKLLVKCDNLLRDHTYISHPKLEILIDELKDYYSNHQARDSRVIVFTEFRESALDIVKSVERIGGDLKPHIFIGQSKEKDKFDETKYFSASNKKKTRSKKSESDSESSRSTSRSSSEDAQVKGMNQKLQKDIIKKFKNGQYNILVATSIGEEGLDIGEVDLIVCYDSTSSPIKNIQRMGRTGRKRDGKVLLLFSSNEESKFDKAMGGYEYIQQHIMKGTLLNLSSRNRIIPKKFEPVVEKRFIEIPEENLEIKVVDDEDEIIRIATNYMTGGIKKSKAKKTEKRFFMPDNVETGFRSAASLVKRVCEDTTVSERKRSKDLLDEILDSDSDDMVSSPKTRKTHHSPEENVSSPNTSAASSSLKDRQNDLDIATDEGVSRMLANSSSIKLKEPKNVQQSLNKGDSVSSNNNIDLHTANTYVVEHMITKEQRIQNPQDDLTTDSGITKDLSPPPNIGKNSAENKGFFQQQTRTSTKEEPQPNEKAAYGSDKGNEIQTVRKKSGSLGVRRITSPPVFSTSSNTQKKSRGSLGLKRKASNNVIDQLKQQQTKIIKRSSNETINIDDESDAVPQNSVISLTNVSSEPITTAHHMSNQQTETTKTTKNHDAAKTITDSLSNPSESPFEGDNEDEGEEDEDVFNDGLDDELVLIAAEKSPSFEKPDPKPSLQIPSQHRIIQRQHPQSSDQLFKNEFGDRDGLLNEDQVMELYTSYFTTLDPREQIPFYNPSDAIQLKDNKPVVNHSGSIGHGRTASSLITVSKLMHSLTASSATGLNNAYCRNFNYKDYTDDKCISYLNTLVVSDDS